MSKSYSILLTILVTLEIGIKSSDCLAYTPIDGERSVAILNRRFQNIKDFRFEYKGFGTDVQDGRKRSPGDWKSQIANADHAYEERYEARLKLITESLDDNSGPAQFQQNERQRSRMLRSLSQSLDEIDAKQFSDVASFVVASGKQALVVDILEDGLRVPSLIVLPPNPDPHGSWDDYLTHETLELLQSNVPPATDFFDSDLQMHVIGINAIIHSAFQTDSGVARSLSKIRQDVGFRRSETEAAKVMSENAREQRLENFLNCYERLRRLRSVR